MKKLLILVTALLVCGAIQAQGSKEKISTKSFLAFHAGPSLAVGDFNSKNYDNADAGFAKTGFTLNLSYGYQLEENFGLMASVIYNNSKLDNVAIQKAMEAALEASPGSLNGLKLDHWQWYGLTVGPALMQKLASDFYVDIRVMTGIVNANSPAIKYQGQTLVSEDWSIGVPLQAGADLRIGIGKNAFLFANVDYLYMKPKFNENYNLGEIASETIKQKISVVNLTGGLGIRF